MELSVMETNKELVARARNLIPKLREYNFEIDEKVHFLMRS